jgi:hypothetical protein
MRGEGFVPLVGDEASGAWVRGRARMERDRTSPLTLALRARCIGRFADAALSPYGGERRWLVLAAQRSENRQQHSIQILCDLIIPESQYPITERT